MKRTILISTAAAALLITGSATAQMGNQNNAPNPQVDPRVQNSPTAPTQRNRERDGTTGQNAPAPKDAPQTQNDNRNQPDTQNRDRTRGQNQQNQRPSNQDSVKDKSDRNQNSSTSGQGGSGAAGGGLTTENRGRVRDEFKRRGGHRVDNVNFTISVGTVVPRSVRLVSVPGPIVEIVPAWRGYLYFMVGDEIIIVEPRSMKIVAVIEA
jgi:hypothetical protein